MHSSSRAVAVLAVAVAACGGGSDGGGGGGNADWLTFDGPTISLHSQVGRQVYGCLEASTDQVFEPGLNVALTDPDGILAFVPPPMQIRTGRFAICFTTRTGLAVGDHPGAFKLLACRDALSSCKQRMPGSPVTIPYVVHVLDPASFHFQSWENRSTEPVLVLAALGSKLVALWTNGVDAHTTSVSTDGAATFAPVAGSGPPLRSAAATASDGTTLWLAGGNLQASGQATNEVWRFDGAAWTKVTVTVAFTPRAGHALVARDGKLWVLGGSDGTTLREDLWRSDDGGVEWTRVGPLPPGAQGPCAVAWGGGLLVGGAGLWTSQDGGATWSAATGFVAPYARRANHCGVMGGRLFVMDGSAYGLGFSTVSSADLASWSFEPQEMLGNIVSGMVSTGDHLYFAVNSSARFIYRTAP